MNKRHKRLGVILVQHKHIVSYSFSPPPDWLDAVRSLETLALVCFLVCVAVELYQDVFKSPPPRDNKAVEILAGLAGEPSFLVSRWRQFTVPTTVQFSS